MIDFEFLEKLIDLLNRSGVSTIEIRKWPWSTSVKVSKSGEGGAGGAGGAGGPVTYQVSHGNPAEQALESGKFAGSDLSAAESAAATAKLVDIESPMVGTYYARPEPGADLYVTVGSRISPGTTLCIIEAMKIMNPLDAEVSGVIQEVLVEDAQSVEFGQVLFRVDPDG